MKLSQKNTYKKTKITFILILIFINISFINSLQITEIELNPLGTDSGNEWIELFSKQKINLKDYIIKNNDGDKLIIKKEFSGYEVIQFKSQWLDNSEERIIILKNNKELISTPILEDSENNNKTHQLCNNQYLFQEQTKGKENKCDKSKEQEISKTSSKKIHPLQDFIKKESSNEIQQKSETKNIINLNPQDTIKEEVVYESKNEKIKKYSPYALCGFLILIIFLLLKNG